jgi:hypothetical protein
MKTAEKEAVLENAYICGDCMELSRRTKRKVPGSIIIELILWCCILVPGLVYSIWRHTAIKRVCLHCGKDSLVRMNTPRGKMIYDESRRFR